MSGIVRQTFDLHINLAEYASQNQCMSKGFGVKYAKLCIDKWAIATAVRKSSQFETMGDLRDNC